MKTKIVIKNKPYNIEISEVRKSLFKVRVEKQDFFFVKDRSGKLILIEKKDYPGLDVRDKNEVISNVSQQKDIKTPIAGIISKNYVKKGETVRPDQVVITLVAMKMENEIISEGHGRVKKVCVKEKQFVNSEDTLILLE